MFTPVDLETMVSPIPRLQDQNVRDFMRKLIVDYEKH